MHGYDYVRHNYERLSEEIRSLGRAAGREVTLVAVTKSGSDEELLALAAAGVTDIGENRPQELYRRGALLAEHGSSPRLHEIGNLQRNKVGLVVGRASLIHSVGKLSLAEEISKRAVAEGITQRVLVELNSASEPNKGGALPEEIEALAAAVSELPGLSLSGLMTMGPVVEESEQIRPYFRLAREIFDKLNKKLGFEGEGVLSMGMSDSYAVAIEEGATLVRVGRRLFEKEGI